MVKNLPVRQKTQETLVQSLGWEDPLEEGMATHSSILAWRIPWVEEPGRLQSMGSQKSWAWLKPPCTSISSFLFYKSNATKYAIGFLLI